METENNLNGLKGWLIFIGFGLVVTPIRLGMDMVPAFYNMFTDGTFEYLTTPGTESYHPLWKPLLIFEIMYNGFMILFSLFLVYLFFKKHFRFPKLYIGFCVLPIIIIPLDAWLVSFVAKNEMVFDYNLTTEFVRSIVGVLIWIPYMLFSKRVKATFIEGQNIEKSNQLLDMI